QPESVQVLVAVEGGRARGIPLPMADAFNAGTIDLAVIARRVEEKGDGDSQHGRRPQAGERQSGINEDQEHERWNGTKEVDPCHRHPAHGAKARKRDDRERKPPDQSKRNDEETNHDGLLEAGKDERERSLHDAEVEELLNDRFHQTLRQANLVSRKRPSTTTGMNRIT